VSINAVLNGISIEELANASNERGGKADVRGCSAAKPTHHQAPNYAGIMAAVIKEFPDKVKGLSMEEARTGMRTQTAQPAQVPCGSRVFRAEKGFRRG